MVTPSFQAILRRTICLSVVPLLIIKVTPSLASYLKLPLDGPLSMTNEEFKR